MWLYRNLTNLISNVFIYMYMYLLLWIFSFSSNGDNLMKQQDLHIATYKFCIYSSEVPFINLINIKINANFYSLIFLQKKV